jgi:hypothetical protein
LWKYVALAEPKILRDAGGRNHQALGTGFLMVPTTATSNVEPVLAYFTPTIEATIISPGGTCRHKRHTYKAHCVETDHDSGRSRLILRHRLRRDQDLTFDCMLQDGLSFTAPLYAPSIAQRTMPLPKPHLHARLIHIDDLSADDPLLDPDALFAAPHGRNFDDLVHEPSIIHSLSSPVPAGTSIPRPRRLDDADDRVLFINHLNRDALRTLWHQRLGHIHGRRVSDMHKYAIGVPELPLASSADQCPTCMAAKMRKSARGLDDSNRATQCHQGLSIDFGFVVQASKKFLSVPGQSWVQPRDLLRHHF